MREAIEKAKASIFVKYAAYAMRLFEAWRVLSIILGIGAFISVVRLESNLYATDRAAEVINTDDLTTTCNLWAMYFYDFAQSGNE